MAKKSINNSNISFIKFRQMCEKHLIIMDVKPTKNTQLLLVKFISSKCVYKHVSIKLPLRFSHFIPAVNWSLPIQ